MDFVQHALSAMVGYERTRGMARARDALSGLSLEEGDWKRRLKATCRQQEPVRVGWSTGEGRRGKRILPAADGGLLCGACFCRHPVRLVVVHPLPEQKEAFEEDVAKGKVAPTLSTHVSNFLNKVPNFL